MNNTKKYFIFYNGQVLGNENTCILNEEEIKELKIDKSNLTELGLYNKDNYKLVCLKQEVEFETFSFKRSFEYMNGEGDLLESLLLKATHLHNWISKNNNCSNCGSKIEVKDLKAYCSKCNYMKYPKISPAVIVGIFKDEEILLARNKNFPEKLFSLIAGFVDVGETLEECVKREIKEEVGIEVTNIKYYSSQPWPFPDSIMIAFTADYLSGEIKVDNVEIEEAHWFSFDELPLYPTRRSIAGKLINTYMDKYKTK